MKDAEVKMMAVAAILIAGAVYMRTKKGASPQGQPGMIFDGYGWVRPGTPYPVTWGG